MATLTTSFTVRITAPKHRVPGKLADAELEFLSGPLSGYCLEGFTIWEHAGKARTVTFPSRPFSVGGLERRHVLLRSFDVSNTVLTTLILEAYEASR